MVKNVDQPSVGCSNQDEATHKKNGIQLHFRKQNWSFDLLHTDQTGMSEP